MSGPNVVVVGSLNVDIVVPVPHLPAPGETIAGKEHFKALGGKGGNQAVAAARLGQTVAMVGRVGRDAEGTECLIGIEHDGVDTRFVIRDEEVLTGVALIAVDPNGENSIVVGQGSNARVNEDDVLAAERELRGAAVVLVQLEIPLEAVGATAAVAEGTLILDPAPARPLPNEILERVNVLTPNEVELAMLSGMSVETHDDVVGAARAIEGPEAIAVTLGQQGVTLVTTDDVVRIPAHPVDVVDTTAAGDAFCGALADALARGEELVAATRWAVAAAAVAVTRMGAQPSLPTAGEVRALLESSS